MSRFIIFCLLAGLVSQSGCTDSSGANTNPLDAADETTDLTTETRENPPGLVPVGTVREVTVPLAGGLPAETLPDRTDRPRQELDGDWRFRFDDEDVGIDQAWFNEEGGDWDLLPVPATWDLAHPQGFDRQTVGWYVREFTPEFTGPRVILRFEGVFREARVWLDGKELGSFELPYLPFAFDVTGLVEEGRASRLTVRIDNRILVDTLPCSTTLNPGKHGWFPYGGLTRQVYLSQVPGVYTARLMVHADLDGSLTGDLWFTGKEGEVRAEVLFQEQVILSSGPLTLDSDELRLEGRIPEPLLWSPETPENIYTFRVKVSSGEAEETSSWDFAIKSFEARDEIFLLNGEQVFLRGINRHEDDPDLGPVFNQELLDKDLDLIEDLGANFTRPGHYPNDRRVLQAMEARGLMIAQEIPVYQLNREQMADPVLVDKATRELQIEIIRDFNRPGIVMWSVANEIFNYEATCTAFVRALYTAARAQDPWRPVMTAQVTVPKMTPLDTCSGEVDVVGVNEYFGWYYGSVDEVPEHLAAVRKKFPGKTLFMSEFGAGALRGSHLEGEPGPEALDDHSYSEEFQVWFHQKHTDAFLESGFIQGMMPWVFADFRMQWSPGTGNPHPVPLMNLKGLVGDDRQTKDSYYFFQSLYRELTPGS